MSFVWTTTSYVSPGARTVTTRRGASASTVGEATAHGAWRRPRPAAAALSVAARSASAFRRAATAGGAANTARWTRSGGARAEKGPVLAPMGVAALRNSESDAMAQTAAAYVRRSRTEVHARHRFRPASEVAHAVTVVEARRYPLVSATTQRSQRFHSSASPVAVAKLRFRGSRASGARIRRGPAPRLEHQAVVFHERAALRLAYRHAVAGVLHAPFAAAPCLLHLPKTTADWPPPRRALASDFTSSARNSEKKGLAGIWMVTSPIGRSAVCSWNPRKGSVGV